MTCTISPRVGRRSLVGLSIAVLLRPSTAAAEPSQQDGMPAGFYQATAIVTGTDMRQRPSGFADCLMQVLLKLTGQPTIRDNVAVTSLTEHADTLVDHFVYVDPRAALLHHDDQGTYDRPHELTVWFKPHAVDDAIERLGLRLWHGPRPVIVPVVLVQTKDPEPFLLSEEAPQGVAMRAALVRVASGYGVGVHFPTAGELAEWGVDTVGAPNPLGAPTDLRLRVAGTLSFNVKEAGWTGSWSSELDGAEHHWEIHGVGFDQAFENMASGAIELAARTGIP